MSAALKVHPFLVESGSWAGSRGRDFTGVASSRSSFHTNTVGAIFDKAFATMKKKAEKGVGKIVEEFVASLPPEPAPSAEEATSGTGGGWTEPDGWPNSKRAGRGVPQLSERRWNLRTRKSPERVAAFIRRQELRGSDVRLDLGSLYKPDAFPRGSIDPSKWLWHVVAYSFKYRTHKRPWIEGPRGGFWMAVEVGQFLSVPCVAFDRFDRRALCGGQGQKQLEYWTRPFVGALQCAGGIVPILGWVESEDNPADAPSRRYAA